MKDEEESPKSLYKENRLFTKEWESDPNLRSRQHQVAQADKAKDEAWGLQIKDIKGKNKYILNSKGKYF